MQQTRISYWRAFWLTAAVVGTINALLFAYMVSRPFRSTARGMIYFDAPEWVSGTAFIINLPVIFVGTIAFDLPDSRTPSDACYRLAVFQVAGTIFWACIGCGIEALRALFKRLKSENRQQAPEE